ncbi:hypothetical protein [Colwellia sp. E150_009]
MAYSTAILTTKTNVEALITALTGSETIDELLIIAKAATGLNCSNYSVLETAIETLIDTQTSSTAHEDILLASRLINATQAQTHTTYETHVVTSSNAAHPVPANAVRCFVSCGAAGGNGYSSSNGGGGGGGASVVEFPIGVTAGGTLSVTVGSNQVIGNLEVKSGGHGNYYTQGNGGEGGRVLLSGIPQPESSTVINGGDGGDVTTSSYSNGESAGGFSGGIGADSGGYYFGGGGASYGGEGGDYGTSLPLKGVTYGSGGSANTNTADRAAGTYTDITLKFEIVTVV